MKKISLVLLIALVVFSAVATCFADDVPEVRVWFKKSYNEAADAELTARFEDYCNTTGECKAVVEMIPNSNFGEKFAAAIESGDVPDVAYSMLYLIRDYYDKDMLMDMTDVVKNIESKGHELSPMAKDTVNFEGENYACVPFYEAGAALYYRTDYLAAAGWNEPPKTWEEVRQCAIDVTKAVPGVYGLGLTYGKAPDTENNTRSIIFSQGGHFFDEEGNTSVTAPETLEALKWVTDLYLVDKCVPPTAVSWDDAGNNKAYLSGQVAMIINAASLTMELKKDENAELGAVTGLAPMPAGTVGTHVVSGPQYLCVFNNAKYPEIAKKMIEYELDFDFYHAWIDEMCYADQPIYHEISYEDPYITAYLESNENLTVQGWPGPYTGVAARTWSSYLLTNFYQSVLVDGVSVEEAAAEMAKEIDALR